jgi:hypothetical protein
VPLPLPPEPTRAYLLSGFVPEGSGPIPDEDAPLRPPALTGVDELRQWRLAEPALWKWRKRKAGAGRSAGADADGKPQGPRAEGGLYCQARFLAYSPWWDLSR